MAWKSRSIRSVRARIAFTSALASDSFRAAAERARRPTVAIGVRASAGFGVAAEEMRAIPATDARAGVRVFLPGMWGG